MTSMTVGMWSPQPTQLFLAGAMLLLLSVTVDVQVLTTGGTVCWFAHGDVVGGVLCCGVFAEGS